MTDTEVIQLLSRLRDEKRLRSWVVSCDEDGLYYVLVHWRRHRVPLTFGARTLGEAMARAMEDE